MKQTRKRNSSNCKGAKGQSYQKRDRDADGKKSMPLEPKSDPRHVIQDSMRYQPGTNDYRWYASNEQLLKDSASLPFSNRLGSTVKLNGESLGSYTVPGIMAVEVLPTPPSDDSPSSPLNLAATKLYTFVRHMNSGSANYDAPDLMMYILAMDQIYAGLAYLRRVYRVASLYSVYNSYLPDTLLRAMGFNPNDVRSNMANYRAQVNILASKASQFKVPRTMPLFERHVWLSENVYMDQSSAKAQLYFFKIRALQKFKIVADKGALAMINAPWYSSCTVAEALAYVEDLLNAVIEQEDFGIMSGDILKAYGDNVWSLTDLREGDYLMPVYNEEVLSQIHNCTTFPEGYSQPNVSITQNEQTGYLTSLVTFTAPTLVEMGLTRGMKHFLNSRFDNPEPKDVMVMTRLMAGFANHKDGKWKVVVGGSEVVTRLLYYVGSVENSAYTTMTTFDAATLVHKLCAISQFDWHPLIYVVDPCEVIPTTTSVLGDINNFTILDDVTLSTMSTTALLSELDVGI